MVANGYNNTEAHGGADTNVSSTGNAVLYLIDVSDGYHLWSETYDRQLDDVFAIQDEIATEVVGALKQTLLGEDDKIVIRDMMNLSISLDHRVVDGVVAAEFMQ